MGYVIRKSDSNQVEIVSALRKAGCSVCVISSIGKGIPDLICAINGHNLLFEVKDGKKPPNKQRLTELEEKFRESWRGHYAIVNSIESALEEINKYR